MGKVAIMYTLYHGDCTQIIPTLKTDHVIGDPPYDAKTHVGQRSHGEKKSKIDFTELSNVDFTKDLLSITERWVVLFCSLEMLGDYKAASPESWVRSGIWIKPNSAPQFTGDRPAQGAEGIAIMHNPSSKKSWNGKGKRGIWYHNVNQANTHHPTEKPLGLMIQLIEDFTHPGETILDPFMGSGTTGVACMLTGRHFIGIEVDKEHYTMAEYRIKNANNDFVFANNGQLTLFR